MPVNKKKIEHYLIPEHELLEKEEEEEILKKFGIEKEKMPRILKTDPAIQHLKIKKGRIIKITRDSEIAGKNIYYRVIE